MTFRSGHWALKVPTRVNASAATRSHPTFFEPACMAETCGRFFGFSSGEEADESAEAKRPD